MDIEQFNTASSLTLPSIMQGRLAQNAACPALFNRGKRSYHDLQKKVVRGKDGSRYLNRAVLSDAPVGAGWFLCWWYCLGPRRQ